MLLKAAVLIVTVPAEITTSGLLGTQDNTSIAKTSEQLVEWYKNIII